MPFRDWPAWLKLLLIALASFVVLSGLWLALRDTLCSIDVKDWILKRPTRGACFEFWFNRYQSLIGNSLTAAVAGVTLLWLAKQLSAAHRQVEAADRQAGAAAAQALRGKLPDFESDRAALITAGRQFSEVLRLTSVNPQEEANSQLFQRLVSRVDKSVTAITDAVTQVSHIQTRSTSADLFDLSGQIGMAAAEALRAAEPILTADFKIDSKEISFDQVDLAMINFGYETLREKAGLARDLINTAMEKLIDEIELTWDRIRSAEAAASEF